MGDHLGDVLGGAGIQLDPLVAEGVHVDEELMDEALGDGLPVLAGLARPVDDLVVDVREVHGFDQVVALVLEVAPHHVPGDVALGMAQVGVVVDRGPADVHGHARGVLGLEGLQAVGPVVRHLQHGVNLSSISGRGAVFGPRGSETLMLARGALLGMQCQPGISRAICGIVRKLVGKTLFRYQVSLASLEASSLERVPS
ncbi:hypothetical protein D3C87_1102990 [compost metagenome]